METFGGTTEELYHHVASKFDYNRLSKKKAMEIFKINKTNLYNSLDTLP